jgi:type IV pilus assembly protein PilP
MRHFAWGPLVVAFGLISGCTSERTANDLGSNGKAPVGVAPAPMPPNPNQTSTAAPVPSDLPPLPSLALNPDSFKESPTNRDPFRRFKPPTPPIIPSTRDVLAVDYSIDQLTVKGLASGEALIDDPSGFGWIVKVGDYVGKAESIRLSSATSGVPTNWRVDSIRENDVVFVRENPLEGASAPPTTKTLALRSPLELKGQFRTRGRGARG